MPVLEEKVRKDVGYIMGDLLEIEVIFLEFLQLQQWDAMNELHDDDSVLQRMSFAIFISLKFTFDKSS